MTSLRHRPFWPLLGLCALLTALILILMPAEKTLGQIIKIVYLHGALSRAGMIGFWAAGIVGIIYLLRPRPALARWTQALLLGGWSYWAAHFLVSMPATRLTWVPWIAWGKPRVTMTLQVLLAGLVVVAITRLLKDARFTAGLPRCWRLPSSCWWAAPVCCAIRWIPSARPHPFGCGWFICSC